MGNKEERDIEKSYSTAEFVAKTETSRGRTGIR